MTEDDFKRFDRSLEDFRNDVAVAATTMSKAVDRYVAMMNAIDTAFVLYYDDMSPDARAKMKAAFDKIVNTVGTVEAASDNVIPIKK